VRHWSREREKRRETIAGTGKQGKALDQRQGKKEGNYSRDRETWRDTGAEKGKQGEKL
jgi:hypothetical protein